MLPPDESHGDKSHRNISASVELTAHDAAILEKAIQNGDIADGTSLELFLLNLAMDQTLKNRKFQVGHFDMERPECLGGRQEMAREMDSFASSSGSRTGLVKEALNFSQRQWIHGEGLFGLLGTFSWGDADRDGKIDSFFLSLDQGYSGSIKLERLNSCPAQDRRAQDEEDEFVAHDSDGRWLDALNYAPYRRRGANLAIYDSSLPQ